ncbi:MAG: hypothetical protein IKX67_02700 [Bacteroidales bacterium]|nr:hypothetical protein [Bacteroidales bacterium]
MYRTTHLLKAALLLALAAVPLRVGAQELGLYNSPKGIGATLRQQEHDGIFHSALFYVDIYGVATSRCSYPGYKLNVSRQYVLKSIPRNGYTMTFYAGPGLSAGYVRDHDKGRGLDMTSLMSDYQGVMAGLSGDAGCRFDFGGNIALDLSLMAEAGVHVRQDTKGGNFLKLSIYNNGLIQSVFPQLTFLFKL